MCVFPHCQVHTVLSSSVYDTAHRDLTETIQAFSESDMSHPCSSDKSQLACCRSPAVTRFSVERFHVPIACKIVTANLTGESRLLPSGCGCGDNQQHCGMQQYAFRQRQLATPDVWNVKCCLLHMRYGHSAVPLFAAMYRILVTSGAESAISTLAHQTCEPTSKKVNDAWMLMTCSLADLQTGSC